MGAEGRKVGGKGKGKEERRDEREEEWEIGLGWKRNGMERGVGKRKGKGN